MKLNIKGLVFVGFAAAVFASAANAAGEEKTVTSLKYTEATYQAKTAANNEGKVLKMASNTAGDIGYATVDTTVTADSPNLITSGAVADYVDTAGGNFQTLPGNDDGQKVAKAGGGWEALTVTATPAEGSSTPFTAGGAYTQLATKENVSNKTQTIAATGSTSNDKYPSETAVRAAITAVEAADDDTTYTFAEGSTDGAFQVTPEGGTAQSVPVHGLAAAAYKGVAASIADGEQGLTTGDQVYDAIQTVAAADDDTTYTFAEGSTDGAFQVTPEGGTAQSVPVHGLAAAAYKPVDTSITAGSTSTNLPTTQAVAAYVDGLIPAAPTTGEGACSAANPCALVSDGATVTWQRIQQ